MTNVSTFPLIDGPLINANSARRLALVQRMANDLVTYEAFRVKADAVRCLLSLRHKYNSVEVAMLYDDAMALAFQDVVAAAMSQP